MNQTSIKKLKEILRHGTIQFTEMWCRDNRVEIHICENTGMLFVYSFQVEAKFIKRSFEALQKLYGKEIWEKLWQSTMKEEIKQSFLPIIFN